MAVSTKKKTTETTEVKEEKKAMAEETTMPELPEGVVYSSRKQIPLDALVYVKNLTGGKLIYHDPRTGYLYTWEKYGEEIPIEMRELINMKNTNSKFFTENWIQMDVAVLRDLHMDNYYKDFISYEDIEKILDNDVSVIVDKVKNASSVIRNSIGIRAMQLIDEHKLTDINVIRALQEALGCSLIDS